MNKVKFSQVDGSIAVECDIEDEDAVASCLAFMREVARNGSEPRTPMAHESERSTSNADAVETRTCIGCDKDKPLVAFDAYGEKGLRRQCKVCRGT
jgi:hypothetical protein